MLDALKWDDDNPDNTDNYDILLLLSKIARYTFRSNYSHFNSLDGIAKLDITQFYPFLILSEFNFAAKCSETALGLLVSC